MLIPFMEYVGFMLLPCTIDDRSELQTCQNDALRLCTRIRVSDHVKIVDLHARCNIISLEQQRRIQLVQLMYKKSKDMALRKVFPRNIRGSNRIVFKTANYEGTLYKRSPYSLGDKLWDGLSASDIDSPDFFPSGNV